MITFNWRRYSDEKPSNGTPVVSVVVILGGTADGVESGSYYTEDEKYFLNEDFREAKPDDLWIYQHELMPE